MKALAGLLLLGLAACTTSHGFVNYKEVGVFSSENVGNKKFQDVGPVQATVRDYAWASCDEVSRDAVRDLIDLAKARGANTVYNVKFSDSQGLQLTPTCSTGWGWFALYVVGGLGPWVQVSSAEGVAAKLDDGEKMDHAIIIHEGEDTGRIAADFVAHFSR